MPRQIRETFRPDMPNRTYFTPPPPRPLSLQHIVHAGSIIGQRGRQTEWDVDGRLRGGLSKRTTSAVVGLGIIAMRDRSGRHRLDRPPVADGLDDQAAPSAAGHALGAASLHGEPLHRDVVELALTRDLEVAAAVPGEARTAERPDQAPAVGHLEQPAVMAFAARPLPQDSGLRSGRGWWRQGRRW